MYSLRHKRNLQMFCCYVFIAILARSVLQFCSEDGLRDDGGDALAVCGAHWECVRSVWDPIQVVARMGHSALDVRLWCDVCLVLSPDIRHTLGIGVATVLPRWSF